MKLPNLVNPNSIPTWDYWLVLFWSGAACDGSKVWVVGGGVVGWGAKS